MQAPDYDNREVVCTTMAAQSLSLRRRDHTLGDVHHTYKNVRAQFVLLAQALDEVFYEVNGFPAEVDQDGF